MLSKALSALAAAGADPPLAWHLVLQDPMTLLLAAGGMALVGWGVVRLARPGKFLLRRTPGRQNHLTLLHVAALFLLQLMCMGAAHHALAALAGAEPTAESPLKTRLSILAVIFGQTVWIAASLAVASMTFRRGLGRGLGASPRRALRDAARGLVGALAVMPLCQGALFVTSLLIKAGVLPIEPKEHPVLVFIQTATPAWTAVAILGAVVVAPLAEEIFFRGLLQSMLRRHFRTPWAGVLLTAAIFAAAHWGMYQDWPALFLLGVVLGYNYERTGRLLSPVLLHALFNAAMIWVRLAGPG